MTRPLQLYCHMIQQFILMNRYKLPSNGPGQTVYRFSLMSLACIVEVNTGQILLYSHKPDKLNKIACRYFAARQLRRRCQSCNYFHTNALSTARAVKKNLLLRSWKMSGLLMEQCLTKPPALHSHLHIKMTLSGESAFNPIKNLADRFSSDRQRVSVSLLP